MDAKKPWQSKSVWAAIIVAASALVPQVQAMIAANPQVFSSVLGALFLGLRLISKDKISIS